MDKRQCQSQMRAETAHLLPLLNSHGFDDYSEDEMAAEAYAVVWKAEFDAVWDIFDAQPDIHTPDNRLRYSRDKTLKIIKLSASSFVILL